MACWPGFIKGSPVWGSNLGPLSAAGPGFGAPQPVQKLLLAAFCVPQGPVQPPAASTLPAAAGCTGAPIGTPATAGDAAGGARARSFCAVYTVPKHAEQHA